jgi:hypothetical protein
MPQVGRSFGPDIGGIKKMEGDKVPLAALVANAARKGDDIRTEYRPGFDSHRACSRPCHGAQGTETSCSRGRAIGIVSRTVGAMVLSRALSRIAHDHADELTKVNRALPGS